MPHLLVGSMDLWDAEYWIVRHGIYYFIMQFRAEVIQPIKLHTVPMSQKE